MKRHLSKNELIDQFKIQLDTITQLSNLYDKGNFNFAQEIAVKLRIIFHNTNNSKSLITQLKLDHLMFVDTAFTYSSRNLITHFGLIKMRIDRPNNKIYYIPLGIDNEDSPKKKKLVSLDNWWDGKKVIVDENKNAFTRKRIIQEVANTDGGAHVDSALEEDYYNLSRQNSLGWWINLKTAEKQIPFNDPVPPSIRQIASEVIETFSTVNAEAESKLRK